MKNSTLEGVVSVSVLARQPTVLPGRFAFVDFVMGCEVMVHTSIELVGSGEVENEAENLLPLTALCSHCSLCGQGSLWWSVVAGVVAHSSS